MSFKVSILAYELNANRLKKLRRELGYVGSGDFFRTIPLSQEREQIKTYMEQVSPKGEMSETKQWLAANGQRRLSVQFAKSWRITRETEGNRIVWRISNVLSSGSARDQMKFYSIEFGSRTSTWIAERTLRFKNSKWFAIGEGSEVRHWGNRPADVIKKTSDFVLTEMLPLIRTKISGIVETRLDAI